LSARFGKEQAAMKLIVLAAGHRIYTRMNFFRQLEKLQVAAIGWLADRQLKFDSRSIGTENSAIMMGS
jgi:hypothetical protein